MSASPTRCAYHIYVYGRVQGVGFRNWTLSLARQLEITGWVRNTGDYDCVEVFAEGTEHDMNEFLYALEHEHPFARVKTLKKNKVSPQNYKRFSIVR